MMIHEAPGSLQSLSCDSWVSPGCLWIYSTLIKVIIIFSKKSEDSRITHAHASPQWILMCPQLSLDITALAKYSISYRGTSSGIQNLSQSHQKLGENQKFAFVHLGSLAAPGDLEENASHHSPSLASLRKQAKLCESCMNPHCAPAHRNCFWNVHLGSANAL